MEKIVDTSLIKVVVHDGEPVFINVAENSEVYMETDGMKMYAYFPEIGQTRSDGAVKVVRIKKFMWDLTQMYPIGNEVIITTVGSLVPEVRWTVHAWADYVFQKDFIFDGSIRRAYQNRNAPRLLEYNTSVNGSRPVYWPNATPDQYINTLQGTFATSKYIDTEEYVFWPWLAFHLGISLVTAFRNSGGTFQVGTPMSYTCKLWYDYVWISGTKYQQMKNLIFGEAKGTIANTGTITKSGSTKNDYNYL